MMLEVTLFNATSCPNRFGTTTFAQRQQGIVLHVVVFLHMLWLIDSHDELREILIIRLYNSSLVFDSHSDDCSVRVPKRPGTQAMRLQCTNSDFKVVCASFC